VARSDARAYEKAVRAFRYPDESIVWNSADLPGLGVRGYLLSDVCAAYCRRAYDAVGGFEHPISTNEDMLIAADLLNAGYCLAYSAGARVWHSHNHTLKQEYLRNRLIGEFLVRYGDRFAQAGETGEGLRLVRHVSKELVCQGKECRFLHVCGVQRMDANPHIRWVLLVRGSVYKVQCR
jgi:rhamnosyltransferase